MVLNKSFLKSLTLFFIFSTGLLAQDNKPLEKESVELLRYENQHSSVFLEPAVKDGQTGIAVIFEGTDDLHFYAEKVTAPGGFNLEVKAGSDEFEFGKAVYPRWSYFKDPALGKELKVYVGNFTVFIPIQSVRAPTKTTTINEGRVEVTISGLGCTSEVCLRNFTETLQTDIDLSESDSWKKISFEAAQSSSPESEKAGVAPTGEERQAILNYSTGVYYLLAILAGISINIMPCVLPVIPLVMMRLIEQSKKSSSHRIISGMAFCVGVILFFAAFALVSAIVNLTTGAVLDLNSLFRYPSAVIVLFLAIVFFGLAMLDIVSFNLPSSITSRQGSGSGIPGSLGMGFFAGILSTPCSGALLGFVLVWAQTQPLFVSSTAIVLMGVGMALPYAVIVLVPKFLDKIPKPGYWMDIFKKTTGFLLFFIAVKLTLAALPKERLLNVLTYGIIFSFGVWMWNKWVKFSDPSRKKVIIRAVALLILVGCGVLLLPAYQVPVEAAIDWHSYDASAVQQAKANGRPVLIKFTADWCTNCKIVEREVYHDQKVAELIKSKNVLPIKADTTLIDYQATTDFKEVYGEAGNVPVTIVIMPGGEQRKLRGIFDKQELIEILNKLSE